MKATLVLYTYGLRGQMSLLPPLFTFLRDLRKTYATDTTLLLDLGDACVPELWHCAATEGRSMLIVMDALGYHAANVSGYLSEDGRAKLADVVSIVLVSDGKPFTSETGIAVDLNPTDEISIHDNTLRLARVTAGQVGVVRISDTNQLTAHEILDMAAKTAPDPTIAGVVDFVLSEAKFYRKKRGEG